jgi:BirA family biotin operon repressor/biotin-[acetyl-CoA-carboxylase] ligase
MPAQLNKDRIYDVIDDGALTGGVHLFDTVDSTNAWSLRQCEQGRELPFVCFAEHQTKGRGRRGHHWVSPERANIYMSLAWAFKLPVNSLGMLSLMQGIAVVQCLRRFDVEAVEIKWPNDVLVNGAKIAGILIETTSVRAESCKAIIGIGLNYQMPEDIITESTMAWTDVAHARPQPLPDRSEIAACLLQQAMAMCQRYQQSAAALVADYSDELEVLVNRSVEVLHEDGRKLTGTTMGLTTQGELRVMIDNREQRFSSADISLLPRVQGENSADH